jgi:hypothetical protein
MCNQRSATLPAIMAVISSDERPFSGLERPRVNFPLRTLLREVFVGPVLRLSRSRPKGLDVVVTGTQNKADRMPKANTG